MGSLSLWHWIIMLVVIGVPALLIGLVIWLIARASRSQSTIRAVPLPESKTAATRLEELDKLKSAGFLTDTEFERKRAEIIESV